MKQRGFTLLEMLIVFAILALLFTALFSAFNTLARGWDAADTRMTKTEDVRLITDFLRRQLSQAMVVKIKGEKDTSIYAFSGTAQAVRYAAPLQPLQHQGGVFLIELALVSSKQGKSLQMLYAPYRPELTWEEAFKEAKPVLVFDGLTQAAFTYFGASKPGADPDWTDDWEGMDTYPQLLKLTMTSKEHIWPEIVVTLPQVNSDGN